MNVPYRRSVPYQVASLTLMRNPLVDTRLWRADGSRADGDDTPFKVFTPSGHFCAGTVEDLATCPGLRIEDQLAALRRRAYE